MAWFWVLGALGMLAIEISYLPQLARLYRRKRADDISPLFPALNLSGRTLAMVYALTQGEAVLGIGFFLGTLVRATFLGQVIYYKRLTAHDAARVTAVLEDTHERVAA